MRVEPNATSMPAGRNASAVSTGDQPFIVCRYSVITNWKPTYAPNSAIIPRFARTREPVRRMPSRTSGERERRSIAMNVASSPAASANATIVSGEPQP